MRKSPTLSTIIVLTLALGIGANSVIFSFVRAVVLRARLIVSWSRTQPQGHCSSHVPL